MAWGEPLKNHDSPLIFSTKLYVCRRHRAYIDETSYVSYVCYRVPLPILLVETERRRGRDKAM